MGREHIMGTLQGNLCISAAVKREDTVWALFSVGAVVVWLPGLPSIQAQP